MPISVVGLDEADPARSGPAVSALVELGSALHVLRDPGHHGSDEWAARVRGAMSPGLDRRTRAWWWTTQAIRSAPFVTAQPGAGEFEDQLARLRARPAARLAGQLLRPISPAGEPGAALHWSRSRGAGVAAVVAALVSRPAEAVEGFLQFLADSWDEWFGAESAPGSAGPGRPDAAVRRHGGPARPGGGAGRDGPGGDTGRARDQHRQGGQRPA